jgi:hypothetical protein
VVEAEEGGKAMSQELTLLNPWSPRSTSKKIQGSKTRMLNKAVRVGTRREWDFKLNLGEKGECLSERFFYFT